MEWDSVPNATLSHRNGTCIVVGNDESHFNVLLTVSEKVTGKCLQITTFEEKGEPKQGIEPTSSASQSNASASPLGQSSSHS